MVSLDLPKMCWKVVHEWMNTITRTKLKSSLLLQKKESAILSAQCFITKPHDTAETVEKDKISVGLLHECSFS